MDQAPLPLAADPRPPSPISAAGHRHRMRQRLLSTDPGGIADHELLEMVLFLALPRRDTKAIARALLSRFGSYAGAIAAPVPALLRVEGLGEAAAAALKMVHVAAVRLAEANVGPDLAHPTG